MGHPAYSGDCLVLCDDTSGEEAVPTAPKTSGASS
jgi:hypothetical protein